MRPVTMLMLALVFALAGTAALANDCNVCGGTNTCVPACAPACAATCPPPCPAPEPCPPVCPPIPAAVGAGPVPAFSNVACPEDFDKAFVQSMYQHHQDIIALATLGIQQACSSELRDLSRKIRQERTDMNIKLVKFGRMMGECSFNVACNTCITDQVSTLVGQDFDVRYAVLMVGLLMQSQEAAQAGMNQSCIADLRNQSRIEYRASANEIAALQNWLSRNGLASTPGTCGAGPVCPTIPPPTPCPVACPAPCPAPSCAPPAIVPVPCPCP